jgi:hypothetical protein
MGEAGYARFEEHFRYERFLDRFMQQVHKLCGSGTMALT